MKELYHETENCETVIFKSMDNMGFVPSQILYVEGGYNEAPNQFILKYFEDILKVFKALNFSFVYLPKIYEALGDQSTWKYLAGYFHPHLRSKIKLLSIDDFHLDIPGLSLSLQDKIRGFFDSIGYRDGICPGLLRLVNESETEGYTFEYFIFDLSGKVDFATQIEGYLIRSYDSYTFNPPKAKDILFKDDPFEFLTTSMPEDKDISDSFSSKISRLYALTIPQNEIKNNLVGKIINLYDEMEDLGLLTDDIKIVIDKLITQIGLEINKDVILSSLIIDSGYKLTLSDYSSTKIKLSTLHKSLYILFLRHPKGILLSHLSDYMPELLVIYALVSGLHPAHIVSGLDPLKINPKVMIKMKNMLESIERICTYTDKSIHEKISVIRKEFTSKEMAAVYADYYIITGKKGEEYKIQLDPVKVIFPNEIKELDKIISPVGSKKKLTILDTKKESWETLIGNYKELVSLIRRVLEINQIPLRKKSWEESIMMYNELVSVIPRNYNIDSSSLEKKIEYYKPVIIEFFQ